MGAHGGLKSRTSLSKSGLEDVGREWERGWERRMEREGGREEEEVQDGDPAGYNLRVLPQATRKVEREKKEGLKTVDYNNETTATSTSNDSYYFRISRDY